MFDNLLNIYAGQIITDINSFDQDRYYYFYNESGQVFGISKSITVHEYQLIKSIYLEKTFYYNDLMAERLHEYVFENKEFPLPNHQQARFFIMKDVPNEVMEQSLNLLKDVLGEIVVLTSRGYHIIFYFDHFDYNIKDLFVTLTDDFGTDFNVHLGFTFSRDAEGSDIARYIMAYLNTGSIHDAYYSTFVDLVLSMPDNHFFELLDILRKIILKKIDNGTIEVIRTLFRNNLNVSQTAKLSYLHRNSLLNKLEFITRETGLNLQDFRDACVMNLLISKN